MYTSICNKAICSFWIAFTVTKNKIEKDYDEISFFTILPGILSEFESYDTTSKIHRHEYVCSFLETLYNPNELGSILNRI